MRFRSVLQEYEARFVPSPSGACPAARGKAEWKVYGNGTRRGKVSLSNLDVPDGTVLELVIEGQQIARLSVHRGKARFRRETERREDVPVVDVDQLLQITYAGQVILHGRFYSE